jgi:uncharacterized membrane protein YhaH (DUF805 family)|tara:strand:- start:130 stop:579 length:450 start_codon:yes stop_codon:yes gene_type:complete
MMESTSTGRPAQMMSFNDAVTNCLINNYMNFSGRASRSEYWFWTLFTFLVSFVSGIIDGFMFGSELGDPLWISNIIGVAIFLPGLAVIVRRLHDGGRSGWWFLLSFTIIGIIPLIIWMIMEGQDHPNEYGEVPTNIIVKKGNGIDYNNY